MYKLLIVDDEFEIRVGLTNYFKWDKLGFEVVAFLENGMKAFNYIKNNPVDVLLCDIRMPIMTGIDLARILHQNKANVKIVFLSGYREFEYAQKALDYGVKHYIVKPTRYDDVVRIFSELKNELDAEKDQPAQADDDMKITGCDQSGEIIETIKLYIQHNYNVATLEDTAKLVFMNPFYLSKFFKQKTGQNFSDYLTKIKMEKAAELLKDISYKTYEVSGMIGYTNPKNFTRAFKKFFGISPLEFRSGGIARNMQ